MYCHAFLPGTLHSTGEGTGGGPPACSRNGMGKSVGVPNLTEIAVTVVMFSIYYLCSDKCRKSGLADSQ